MNIKNNILQNILHTTIMLVALLLPAWVWGQTSITSLSGIDNASGDFIIIQDIDASDFTTSITSFSGTLEAAINPATHMPYRISNLSTPIFATLTGTVKNLVLAGVAIGGGADAGAIASTATGSAKIYNCGVLGGSVSGSGNVGGLVGTIAAGSNVRVVNCYNYATISGGTYAAGIVGCNQGPISGTTTVSTTGVRITNCMMYGDITAGTNRSPVYGGNHTNNQQKLTEYNYYRSRANLTYSAYNDQLAIDKDEFLTRFPFYRHIQNTHRELAAYFLFGAQPTAAQVAEIGHWVLKPDVAPYPVIEQWETDTKKTTVDIAANLPATTDRYAGKLLSGIDADGCYTGDGTLVTAMGDNGYLHVTVVINGTTHSVDLPITDMDTLRYDFTWGKVVLPFANEFSGWTAPTTATTDYGKICTGWKITNVGGQTAFSIPAGEPYNFADRNNPQKDVYDATNNPYIFAQGGNYIVPYGVTSITIEANFANAFYLSDAYADFGYGTGYTNQTNLAWQVPTTYNGKTVYTNLGTLVGKLSNSTNPHSQAIVLVGNYHYNQRVNGTSFNTAKGVTIMSIDEDNNQEPDYGWYSFHTTDRTQIPAMRFDFVPNIGMGMAERVTNSNPNPTIGIWRSYGWFEITETCVSFMSECEISQNDFPTENSHGNNRWIANSGFFKQIVYTRNNNATKMSYVQIGSNAYVEQFYPGPHVNQTNSIKFVPVNVTGGEIEECFMTGKGTNSNAKATGDNIWFWCAGGRIHKYLSSYMVVPSSAAVNVTAKVDHARIYRFFGGGTSQAARITGNIDVTMNNSLVDFYCGGPEFGDMTNGKTVTTHATGTTFGLYYGAGFGGTAITWKTKTDNTRTFNSDVTFTENFNNYTNDRLVYTAGYGFGTCYDFDFIMYAGGGDGNNANGKGVARFYTGYADFSLASTGNVTNVLDDCIVLENFYGGGCQGKVSGSVTSTLTDCLVKGNAFGGGYKPASTTVDVYPATQPTYSQYKKETGLFSDFGTVAPETFTWQQGTAGQKDEANNILYTAVDLSTSGQVDGNVNITVDGNSVIGTSGDSATGNIFGGGAESAVTGNTSVILEGHTQVLGNVFGGGDEGLVDGNSEVILKDD